MAGEPESAGKAQQEKRTVSKGRRTLYVDTPFFWIQSEGLERSLLAKDLNFIDVFIAPIIPSPRIAFGILI